MWPFSSKAHKPLPKVIIDGIIVYFHADVDYWEFSVEGTDFTLAGRTLNDEVIVWAKEILTELPSLIESVEAEVIRTIKNSELNTEAREMLSISLENYPHNRTYEVSYAGDESWADFGVSVVVENGKVTGSFAGD